MASYNTVITNEGAALLASVIANQGTLTFSEMRFSTTDYDGVEQTLTVGTFAGVFITAAASGSVVDATTIKVGAQFDNSGIVGDHPLYSIGIVGTDGNTTALIAVCTTTNPDIIRAALTGVSTYAFNVNLAVSSTLNITVTGTTAAVLYDIDVVDTLISTATDKPLSANMGRVLNENVEAIVDVYGAKNTWDYTRFVTGNGGFTQNSGVYTNTLTDTRPTFHLMAKAFDNNSTDLGYVINEVITGTGIKEFPASIPNNTAYLRIAHNGSMQDFTFLQPITQTGDVILSFDLTSNDPSTVGGLSFTDVMLRDARIIDPTFVPYAKTNLQLTNDKAERADLATLNLTGSTNSTGSTINAGTFFYLNGSYCKATMNISNGATFTLNTNYEEVSLGGEVSKIVQTDDFQHGTTKVFLAKRGCLIIISRQSDGILFIGHLDATDTVSSIVSVNMSLITLTYSAGTISINNQSGTVITATVIGG